MKIKHLAFTLAEVLITLGIIGIVAAMTLPNLIADHKTKEIVSKIKKLQSSFSQAMLMAENEYGSLDTWGLIKDNKESSELLGQRTKPYLKLLDDCGTGTCESYTGEWHMLNGHQDPEITSFHYNMFYKLRLSDGSELFLRPGEKMFTLFMDINGRKTPNILGKDIFRVLVYPNGKVNVTGIGENPNSPGWQQCNLNTGEGWNCAAWVIYKGNMDYLKCADELEWDGKTKCR